MEELRLVNVVTKLEISVTLSKRLRLGMETVGALTPNLLTALKAPLITDVASFRMAEDMSFNVPLRKFWSCVDGVRGGLDMIVMTYLLYGKDQDPESSMNDKFNKAKK